MVKKKENIYFDFEKQEWEGITIEQVKIWESAFPDCDVVDILTKKMLVWFDANPEKARKSRWKKFITNWLSKTQMEFDKAKRFKKGGRQ
jgi:hypothetical protein